MDAAVIDNPPSPGIGHNQPPLAEMLAEETAGLKKRAADLIAVATKIVVADDESVAKAVTLVGAMDVCGAEMEAARVARKAPVIDAGRTIDSHFTTLRTPLCGPDAKKRGGMAATIAAQVDEHRRKAEAAAAAERARLERLAREAQQRADDEARKRREAEVQAKLDREAAEQREREAAADREREQREAADRQRRAEDDARRSGDLAAAAEAARARAETERLEAEQRRQDEEQRRLRAEEEQRRTQARLDAEREETRQREEAARLAREAERVAQPAAISGLYGGKASGRATWDFEIEDCKLALRHAITVNPSAIRAAVEDVIRSQIRAKVRVFPGVRIIQGTATQFRK